MGLWNSFKSLFVRKTPGERRFVSLLQGFGWQGAQTWAQNRGELPLHWKGWHYIAGSAIAEIVADARPQVAFVRKKQEVEGELHKAWFSTRDEWKRAKRLSKIKSKYVHRKTLTKALTNIQAGDQLEPAPTDHRLVRLLNNPNTPDIGWTFRYKLAMYLRIHGGCYIWKIRGEDNLPTELWILPPHWVRAIPSKAQLVAEYEISPSAGFLLGEHGVVWFEGSGGKQKLKADDVIQLGYPHPTHYTDFYSPIVAGAHWTDSAENIERSRTAQFANGAFPGIILELDKEASDPTQDQIDRIRTQFEEVYKGVKHTGKAMILAPGLKAIPTSISPTEMSYTDGADQLRNNLLAIHKIGSSLVGLSEQTTFASMVASRAQAYQGAIKPLLSMVGEFLTERLAKEFDESLTVYWEDPTPTDPSQKLQENKELAGMGARTVNEVRTEYGDEPYPFGGDDPMLPMGSSPVGWATGEQPEPMPGQEQPGMGGEPEQPAEPEKDRLPSQLMDMKEPTALGEGEVGKMIADAVEKAHLGMRPEIERVFGKLAQVERIAALPVVTETRFIREQGEVVGKTVTNVREGA
jgi:phage portal protein BeeE